MNDVAVRGDTVCFTGGFTAVRGLPRNGIAAAAHLVFVGGDTCPAAAFEAPTGRQIWAWPRRVNATTGVLLAGFGRLYVGGAFTQLAGAGAHGLAALDPRTGRPVSTWHPESGSEITALTASRGRILVGADS